MTETFATVDFEHDLVAHEQEVTSEMDKRIARRLFFGVVLPNQIAALVDRVLDTNLGNGEYTEAEADEYAKMFHATMRKMW